jgi:hypothetical protein
VKYPEHEKLKRIADKSQCVGDFIEWLRDGSKHPQGRIELCCWNDRDKEYYAGFERVSSLLARFFEIDENKLEEEKRAMLNELRKQHSQ